MLTLLFGIIAIIACGGSGTTTSADNNISTRTMVGTISSSEGNGSLSALMRNAVEDCLADTVIATDTSGNATSEEVDDSCAFSLNLEVGKAYSISFVLGDQFVANLIFDSGVTGASSSSMSISSGEVSIDLGSVTISGNTAQPTNNPLEYLDQDQDGTSDLEDTDDDNDGIEDSLESDCDLDGFLDDEDDDDECEDESDDEGSALRVKPSNNEENVDLDKKVKVYLSCLVDEATLTSETFQVVSELDESIDCEFQVSDRIGIESSIIKCRHNAEKFEADTQYDVQMSGVRCEDGTEIAAISWSFVTELEDDDEGDAEDEIDDLDEADDDEGEDADEDEDE